MDRMKTYLTLPLAMTLAFVMTGCGSRQVSVHPSSKPVAPLASDEHHASLTFRTLGGAGDHPVSYSLGPADASEYAMSSAGERVYDANYFQRIPGYLKKMAGGTDSIDTLVEAEKTLKVNAAVKRQIATLNGIPMHSLFGYSITPQPAPLVFTPKPHKNYLVETVIADNYIMKVYEISTTGERKEVSVTVGTDGDLTQPAN